VRSLIVISCIALGMTFGALGRAAPAAPEASGIPAVTGPCADFVKAVCAKSGESSKYCTDLKSVSVILPPAACKTASGQMSYVLEKLDASRKVCDQLASKLCQELGKDTESCKMVQKQTKDFAPDRCTTMMDRYPEVLAELKKTEAANKPLDSTKQKQIAASDAPAFGPASSKVTLVEFSDFQCPFCSKAATVVQQIKSKYGTKVRFVYRQFPLSFHQNARPAAQAALAAHAQGKFWEYHDKLFANQTALERGSLEQYAKELGLNMTRFKKALDDKEFEKKVDSDLKLGGDVAVQGTPTVFLNGTRVQNPTDYEAVAKLIDEALASKAK